MQIKKIHTRSLTAILAAILAAAVFIFMFVYLAITQRRHIYESSKEISKEVLRQTANETQLFFSAAYVVANSIQQRALILKELNASRSKLDELLKEVLVANPNILGAWVFWEPNGYDGKDNFYLKSYPCNGRLGISYFREKGTLYAEQVPCDDFKAFFYVDAKKKRGPVLSEPYRFRYTNYTALYYGATISVPILNDTAFLGVVGVDINLSYLQQTISYIRIFESGNMTLVSSQGVIVSHPDSLRIGKKYLFGENDKDSILISKAFEGLEVDLETYSDFLNEKVFRFYYPINLYLSDKPWLVISEIPIEKASSRSRQVVIVATVVLLIGLLLIIYLILNIVERKKYQKKLEEALCEAEGQRLKATESYRNYLEIFNSTNEAIFIHDANTGIIVDVNDMMLKMYGLTEKSQAIGKHVDSFSSGVEPYDIEGAKEKLDEAKRTGFTVFEWQSKRASGEFFWSEVSLRYNQISGQERVLAVVRDVTDRKIAQQALEYREKKFRELADLLPLVVWEVDLKGRFTYANSIGFKLFGYTPEEMEKGLSILDMIAPQERERVAENIRKLIADGKNTDEEYMAIKKDGTVFPVSVYSSVVYSNGKPVGLRGILIDITEKKKVEQQLRDSEQLHRTVVDSLNEALVMVDNDDHILYVNHRFTDLLGYQPAEVLGQRVLEFLVPPDKQSIILEVNKNRLKGEKSVYEMQFIAKDGRYIDFMVSGAPIFDGTGKVTGSIGAMVDITELKNAEKAYHETLKLFETLARMSPVGIFRTDAHGKTTYVNPKWCELSGLTPDQAMGDDWIKAVHPDDRQRVMNGWSDKVNKAESSTTDYRFLKPDGTVVWVLGNALPEESNGKITGYIGTITDITPLKQTQEKLSRSEKRFRELTDLLPQSIWEIDLTGKVTFINKFGLESMGYTQADFEQGVSIFEAIVPEDRAVALENFKKRLSGEIIHGVEYLAQRKNGERFPALVYSNPIVENGKVVGLRGITIDITDIKQAQKELELYRNHLELLVKERTEELESVNEELSAANEELYNQREKLIAALQKLKNAQQSLVQSEKMASLGLLAAGVAHEINNPLNFIQGGITAVENYIEENFGTHKQNLEPLINAIKEGVKRSAQIVRSLNQYSRTDFTKHSNVDIHNVIDNCLILLSNQYRDRIEIAKNYCDCASSLYCNEGQIHQAFMNILINAMQAISDQGRIVITTFDQESAFKVVIEDTGCGIDPKNLSKVFDPFFTTKESGVGTGLGLFITYNIIKEHNGTIELESEKGKGTKVTVVLPKTI